ncbi:unnamed protein product [Bursaphelenchus xylophilus]|uniref:(pine wood nematode) hypothetical protein n=1 Tax=Bursaphelenchus xylophilus TaxID=6326 RepID=A0A1I7RPA7_BURXY|nr:unnamed protein product [Bursaphelenchus xylophilus]CAG9095697.1 unnamed protein product [Bursaphelenchus xylophilus]
MGLFENIGYALYLYGVYTLIKIVYHIGFHAYVYFFAEPKDLKKLARSDWAAITGATDGIGKAYAFELAKRGFNLILISRTQSRLIDTKEKLLAQYKGIQVETIAFDFKNTKPEDYVNTFTEPLKKVGLLFNNVGAGPQTVDRFHELIGGIGENKEIVDVNMYPAVFLSSIVLKPMEERGGGVIVNNGSMASSFNYPFCTAYGLSKSALEKFTHSIRIENPKIHIQYLAPGFITTKLSKSSTPNFLVRTPEDFVESAVKTIGWAETTKGHYAHQLVFDIMEALPVFVQDLLIKTTLLSKKQEFLDELAKKQKQN